jgi:hypothetical protein
MIIGDNAYEVVQGWLGSPTSTFDDHLGSPERTKALAQRSDFPDEPQSEEELLQMNLLKTS